MEWQLARAGVRVVVEAGLERRADVASERGRAREHLARVDGRGAGRVRGRGVLEVVEARGAEGREEEVEARGRRRPGRARRQQAVPEAGVSRDRGARGCWDRRRELRLECRVEQDVCAQVPLARLVVGQASLVDRDHRNLRGF